MTRPAVPQRSGPSVHAMTSGTARPAARAAAMARASRPIAPGSPGRPGGSRRRISSVRDPFADTASNAQVSREAPPDSLVTASTSTGPTCSRSAAANCVRSTMAWSAALMSLTLAHAFRRALAHVPEHVPGDPPHLDLFGPFGDPVPPVVAVNVLERFMPRVAQPAVHLHRAVGSLAAQPVGPVVAHRHLVRDGERAVGVHEPGGLVNQRA